LSIEQAGGQRSQGLQTPGAPAPARRAADSAAGSSSAAASASPRLAYLLAQPAAKQVARLRGGPAGPGRLLLLPPQPRPHLPGVLHAPRVRRRGGRASKDGGAAVAAHASGQVHLRGTEEGREPGPALQQLAEGWAVAARSPQPQPQHDAPTVTAFGAWELPQLSVSGGACRTLRHPGTACWHCLLELQLNLRSATPRQLHHLPP
jgi:hypothetical protein